MSSAFSNALSGLSANAQAIDVVSGNLANLNTSGYKADQVSFQDLINESLATGFNSNEVGGSTISQSTRTFTQGTVQPTSQPYDAAVQGNGFFVLRAASGQQLFTRAGNFKVDASGNLLTQSGNHVQGWNAVNGALNTNTTIPGDIVLPAELRNPSASTKFSLSVNLNSSATVGGPDGSFSSPVQLVDSLGSSHTMIVSYTKSAANTWNYSVSVPASDLAATLTTTNPVATGTLQFDAAGQLVSPAAGTPVAVNVTGLANGAADLGLTWNLYDAAGSPAFTQYSQASANLGSTQDGTSSGQLTTMNIGANGQILAHYSNGDSVIVAQLALGSVLNPDSMQDLGDNAFGVTAATAKPVVGAPGTGSLGQITGGALESSTVDIAKEFTNLLTYQRGYQANSKVITTEDEILQETVGLKR